MCPVCCPILQILTLFRAKKCRFKTLPLNSLRFQLLISERQQKNFLKRPISNSHIIFFSYSFGIRKRQIRSCTPVRPSKTIPDSRPKCAKSIPVFRTETAQKPYPLGRHIPVVKFFFCHSLGCPVIHNPRQVCVDLIKVNGIYLVPRNDFDSVFGLIKRPQLLLALFESFRI